jgi:glycosyltransferase involved in cell wall biosynthesis
MPPSKEKIAEVRKKYHLPEKFLLVVGTIEPRKNYARLVEAIAQMRKDDSALNLVVVGSKGWLYEPLLQRIEELSASEWVHFPGFVPDDDLPAMYAASTLTVMPSLYEGFGLPILEAMASGAAVVSSDAASLPELGGEVAAYFDPHSVESMAQVLMTVLGDSERLQQMRADGPSHAGYFSWDETARQTIAVYDRLR